MKINKLTNPRWGLMIARGALYVGLGVTMFVFANTYSMLSALLIGATVLLAGVLQLVFSLTNRLEKNNIWGILHGITDVGVGIAIAVFSKGTVEGFVDVLGFWAVMYAFLQAVQAMYSFMAARGIKGAAGISGNSVVHFANVLVAGGLAFTLLVNPSGVADSIGFMGIFPISLGILILVLTAQMRAQAPTPVLT